MAEPVLASTEDDCANFTKSDVSIAACNSIISDRSTPPNKLTRAYDNRGNAKVRANQLDQAILDFRSAISIDPTYTRAHVSLGYVLTLKGELDSSIEEFTKAIALDPKRYDAFVQRAFSRRAKKDFPNALQDLSEAIRLNPKIDTAFHVRTYLWQEMGQFDQAIADADECIRLSPEQSGSYVLRGNIWRQQGDLDKALADLDKSVELSPTSPGAAAIRGEIHRYRGEFDLATADYTRALQYAPDSILALTGLGLTLEKMGDLAGARERYKASIESRSLFRLSPEFKSAAATAQARLAALDSGSAQPSIPSAPAKATSLTSVPTPAIVSGILTGPVKAVGTTGGRRVALVIGNSAYKSVPALNNPQKDADAVARSLRNIGFDKVTLVVDGTEQKLIEAVNAFADEAAKSDWAMVYFAGHGIEINGQNYLIPVDAKLATDRDVERETIALERIKTALAGARKLRLVVLDACRVNPFAQQMRRTEAPGPQASNATAGGVIGTRAIGRGLGRIEPGNGGPLLVVFAAKDGQTALDGDGANSPFAVAMVQRIATPGVEISKIFRLVRDDVMEATAGRQEPYTYGSLPGEDFFFVATK